MDNLKGCLVALLVLGGLAFGGAYFYARFTLTDTVKSFIDGVESMGNDRGGRIPDEAMVRTHVDGTATLLGLTLTDLVVTMSENDDLDRTGKLAARKLASVGNIRMQLRRFDVTAHVSAKKWIWTRDQDVTAVLTFRKRVELQPANAQPSTPRMPDLPGLVNERGTGL